MPTTIDFSLYPAYERVIREARPANVYEIKEIRTRADGSTFEGYAHVPSSGKDNLPWGQNGMIQKASWFTSSGDYLERHAWSLELRYHGFFPGLSVTANTGIFDEFYLGYGLIGVAGKMRSPNGQGNLAVKSEDALVERVLADIKKFYSTHIARKRDMSDPRNNDGGEAWNRMFHPEHNEF